MDLIIVIGRQTLKIIFDFVYKHGMIVNKYERSLHRQ